MLSYLDFTDLKTAIIGLVTGIIAYFLSVVIHRYWSNRSAKSLKRRIEEAETQKALLDDLAKSERALLLFGFKSLFALLGLVSLIFALQTFFVSILRGRLDPLDLILVLLWFIPAIISIYLADVVKKLGEYPGSAETIDKKIATLKRKLRGGRV